LAAKVLIALAVNFYDADRISVTCNPENIASLRIIEKCGFHFEGTLRNYLMKPTPEMISDGYSSIRDVSCFSLVSQEVFNLDWFKPFCDELEMITFSD